MPTKLRSPKVLVPVAYACATVLLVLVVGVPYVRDLVALWVMIGILCFSLADLRGSARGLVLEWLPFMAILIAYDSLRGTAGRIFGVHYLPQLRFDQWLFGHTTPTVTLQHWLWHGHVVWYDVVLWCVYLTHFFATPVLAAVLWKLDRPQFRMFAVLVSVLSFMGLITYALYPAAPPWMASQAGLIAPTTRIVHVVFQSLGTQSAGSLIEHGYQYANNVAAVPSLHTAFTLLVAITLWPRVSKRVRPLLALYPLAMAFALVYMAEHYVFDVVLGWIYCVAAVFLTRAVVKLWMARRAPATPPDPALSGPPGAAAPEPAYARAEAPTGS